MTTKRLGKGLEALIRKQPEGVKDSESILYLSVDVIFPNPNQPRQTFHEKSLQELSDSIKEKGIIQPVSVRVENDGYELITGERRWRAAQLAGLTEIPAHILEIDDEAEMMEYALIENIQRDDLNVIEEAEAYAVLTEKYGFSHNKIGKEVGKSRVTISNTLRLLKLPPEVKRGLREDKISAGHARALLGLSNTKFILKLYNRIVEHQESVRTTEELVSRLNKGVQKSAKTETRRAKPKSPELRKIEDDLITTLGTKVYIKTKSKGGTIQIEYYDNDDLDRLLDLFAELKI